jgi:hypothetical protein
MSNDIRDVTHIMVDIETTDTAVTSRILSIGAVTFKLFAPMHLPSALSDVYNNGHQFYAIASETSQLNRTVSPSTMAWWDTQPAEVRDEAFSGTARLEDVLIDFGLWVASIEGDKLLWCKGTDFDFPIVENAMDSYHIKHPWTFRQLRDCRTAFSMFPQVTTEPNATPHNALADALHQARKLHKVLYCAVNAPIVQQSFDC